MYIYSFHDQASRWLASVSKGLSDFGGVSELGILRARLDGLGGISGLGILRARLRGPGILAARSLSGLSDLGILRNRTSDSRILEAHSITRNVWLWCSIFVAASNS